MERSEDGIQSKARRRHSQPKHGAPEPIAALNKVCILEYRSRWANRESLVDIRTHCPDVEPVAGICPYMRTRTADMLNVAQASLPIGHHLRVGTALRTLSMQSGGWDGYFKRMREEHPSWPLSALRRATNKYFAPYDQKAPPGHCTGGAVDVALIGPNGEPLDVTSPTKGWEAAYTWSDLLDPEARANRMIMVEAMLAAGFSNCRDEYWHYSWGDSAWAVRVGKRECPYGWAHPPVALELHPERGLGSDLSVASDRDEEGRVLSATGACRAVPDSDGIPRLNVGLLWAKNVPVVLKIYGLDPAQTSGLLIGDVSLDGDSWEPIVPLQIEAEFLTFSLLPTRDRTYIIDSLPPPEAAESVSSQNS